MHTRNKIYIVVAFLFACSITASEAVGLNRALKGISYDLLLMTGDTGKPDTGKIKLPYPFSDESWNPYNGDHEGGLYLKTPSNINSSVEYDPNSGNYYFRQFFGKDSIDFRRPTYMDLDEYLNYDMEESMKKYWQDKQEAEELNQSNKGWRPTLHIKSEAFDRIFGGNTVDIRPNGSAELIFAANVSRTDNPAIPEKQRRIGTFDFNEKIQINVIGNIGDKLKITTNYNTEATFDFENQMKLEYTGYEDEIIQKIEAGNVTLPLTGSLITGSQSLFGIKTALRFGRLTVTSVLSQQRGKKSEIEVEGGAQIQNFSVSSDEYEDNKHFFLSQYMRDQYETAVANPPLINSGINITKIEVWVTNTTTAYDDTRNIIAFQDLGEGDTNHFFNSSYVQDLDFTSILPDNDANNLYQKMTSPALAGVRGFTTSTALLNAEGLTARQDYQKIELARKLSSSEFTFNSLLGYISLNQELQTNQALAVAFQYTYHGKTYQVGEFSTDGITGENALFLKLLKSTELNSRLPMWNLMMKNVYAIGAYQVQRDGFDLQVWYLNQETGVDINYIPDGNINGLPLLKVLGFDKLNSSNSLGSDGAFDFLSNPQITINPNNGRIFFPLLEPFGSGLRKIIGDQQIADKYAFDSLYTTTKADAQVKFPDKNRFTIKGTYQSSSSSDISLNAINIPEGSVTVTTGGQQLQENIDYTVDYTLGRVKIINQGILESGTPIKISLESNSLFNIQSKTLFASRFDYKLSDDFILGGTVMNLTERPLTQKVNIGYEPMSNTIWGVDGNYRTDSRFLTKLVDKIPLIDTKEKSTVTVSGEFAQLLPGHSRAVGKDGTSYIDDFEGSQSAIDIRSFTTWSIASTPQGQPNLFPEGDLNNNLAFNFNRAKLAWYVIDPLFFRNNNITPDHIKNDPAMQSNHYMREIFEQEVFPNKDIDPGQPSNIPVFDLAFYPRERGPYNYDVDGKDLNGNTYAPGLNPDGTLKSPESRWGGIMRRIETNDFDAANIEFIQFWVMDPFAEEDYSEIHSDADFSQAGGELYFNLGNISEDVLRDGVKSFENGLPTNESEVVDTSDLDVARSVWGRVPTTQAIVNAFDNDIESREFQDIGLDGLRDLEESVFFKEKYIDKIANELGTSTDAYQQAVEDPSGDNYNYFRDDQYDASQTNIVNRYKMYNGLEGNSPTAEQSATLNKDGYPTSSSTLPNAEDINRDNTLDDIESYFQYKVKITPQDINPENVGNNFITDVLKATVTTKDNRSRTVYWYQFKIPIRDPEKSCRKYLRFQINSFYKANIKRF